MAQPTSAARVPSPPAHDNYGTLLPGDTACLPSGNNVGTLLKKRRREGVGPLKKRPRGQQIALCELNDDVLRSVFEYTYPMDLLNLARTCKSLRALLMHKSSRTVWKAAREQIEGLPSCPPDLTEPQYANLMFYARCHGCGKATKTVFWHLRRRYCPGCRIEGLCHLAHCDSIVRDNQVLPIDWCPMGDVLGRMPCVDIDQLDSFMQDYQSSSNKTQFLDEKRELYRVIDLHAEECKTWLGRKGRVHRLDLVILRKERQECILERLKQRGYGPEIAFFQDKLIEESYKSAFKNHKPLMDSEWKQMWPKWVEIMDNFRSQRLEATLYEPRRRLLVSEYDRYVMCPSPVSPTLDVLPHVVDLSRFPPFRNMIKAPEGTEPEGNLFASAFAQLPTLVDEWTRKLDLEVARLVNIPSFLSPNNVPWGQDPAQSIRYTGSTQTDLDKLQLACAVFHVGGTGVFPYPEVLSVSVGNDMIFHSHDTELVVFCREDESERTGSIYDRFGLQFLNEAPYVVHACGLDPNVATVDDMNRRNARLVCLCCGGRTLVMNWRHAIWHARFYHCIGIGLGPLHMVPRWQRVSDEHICAIQAVEQSVQKAFPPHWTRCLLCRPRVGDAMLHENALRHLAERHAMEKDTIKEGIHYKLVGMCDVCVVEMVQIGGRVAYRVLRE